ncbi:hypothetical protein VTK26DRAFT_7214 [Humicola hyalothermophila]
MAAEPPLRSEIRTHKKLRHRPNRPHQLSLEARSVAQQHYAHRTKKAIPLGASPSSPSIGLFAPAYPQNRPGSEYWLPL